PIPASTHRSGKAHSHTLFSESPMKPTISVLRICRKTRCQILRFESPMADEYCHTQDHGTRFRLRSSLHSRSRRTTPTRRINGRRVLSDFYRYRVRVLTVAPRARQAPGSVAPRGHPGGLAPGPTGPVDSAPHRSTLRAA